MKRFALFCMALLAICAAACSTASLAFAEEKEEGGNPIFLPEMYPITFTGKAAKGATFETKTIEGKTFKMVCKGEVSSNGEITSKRLGVMDFTFRLCEEASGGTAKCKTAGDVAGTLLLDPEFHLVAFLVNKKLTAGILILFPKTVVECGLFKDEYMGKILGRIPVNQINAKVKSFEVLYEETNAEQLLKECELPKVICEPGGVKAKFKFEGNIVGAGEFKEAGLEMLEYTITPSKEIEIDA
jgi:hypothetical protein